MAKLYYATDDRTIEGPVEPEALRQLYLRGVIHAETLVAADGDEEWVVWTKRVPQAAVLEQQAAARDNGTETRRGPVSAHAQPHAFPDAQTPHQVIRKTSNSWLIGIFVGAATLVLGLVWLYQVHAAGVLGLFLAGTSLPRCDQAEATKLVGDIVNGMPLVKAARVRYVSLKDVTEQGHNKEAGLRACAATLVTTAGEDKIQYSIKWQSKKDGTIYVQAQVVE